MSDPSRIPLLPIEDPAVIAELMRQALPRDALDEAGVVRRILLDPNFRAHGSLGATEGDQLVGYCLVLTRQVPLENAPSDAEQAYLTLLCVHPDVRRRGIGASLLDAAEAFARAQGCRRMAVSPYAPNYLTPGVDEVACADGLAFLQRHGYETNARPLSMEVDLSEFHSPAHVEGSRRRLTQEGIRFQHFCGKLARPLIEFAEREFRGDWVRVVRDAAHAIVRGDLASRLISALDSDDRILGFSHFDGARFGPIGVAVAERGRGIGGVLTTETLLAQRAQGASRAFFLWTDDRTAERLYAPLGFREARRFQVLSKSLAPGSGTLPHALRS